MEQHFEFLVYLIYMISFFDYFASPLTGNINL